MAEMKGIKKVVRGRSGVIMIRRWMTRRRRKREMAEKLESTALKLEADLHETVNKLKETVLEAVDDEKLKEMMLEEVEKEEKLKETMLEEEQQTKSSEEELSETLTDLKVKLQQDKEDCQQLLRMATEVKEKEGESLYKSVFGMIVQDSMDSIMKREVVRLTVQISLFRNNISRRLLTDETLTDETPLNIMNVPKGFEEAWKVWKEQDNKECQGELSYQALRSLII